MEEKEVEVQCRASDDAVVKKALSAALPEFTSLMKAAGHDVSCKVTMCDQKLPEDSTVGGVVLCAQGFRVIVNNTVEERLAIAYKDQLPKVRASCFPEQA